MNKILSKKPKEYQEIQTLQEIGGLQAWLKRAIPSTEERAKREGLEALVGS